MNRLSTELQRAQMQRARDLDKWKPAYFTKGGTPVYEPTIEQWERVYGCQAHGRRDCEDCYLEALAPPRRSRPFQAHAIRQAAQRELQAEIEAKHGN